MVHSDSSRSVSRNKIGIEGQGNSLGSVLALTSGKGSTELEVQVKEEEKTLEELKKAVTSVKARTSANLF